MKDESSILFSRSEKSSSRRRRRRHDTSFACALLTAATALAASSSATVVTAAANDVDESITLNSITATYGPQYYHARSSLTRPKNLDYTKLTQINYDSFLITQYGQIHEADSNNDPMVLFGPYDWNPDEHKRDTTYCHKSSPEMGEHQKLCAHHHYEEGLLGLAHMNGVKVYASITGVAAGKKWGVEKVQEEEKISEVFATLASSEGSRVEFAEQCVFLIKNYQFDGIDIQWKYPKNSQEMANYVLLLKTVRDRLDGLGNFHGGANYGLTTSVPCTAVAGGDEGDDFIGKQVPNLNNLLTQLNLQTMDFKKPWDDDDKTAGINAPLYTKTDETDFNSVNGCVLKYLNDGASRSKLNVGLPFYGHSYRDATEIGDACTTNWLGECADTTTWSADRGSPKYHSIYDKLPTMPLYWDAETLTPVAFNSAGLVSYDDPKSICYKTEYTMMNKLNGVVIHELGADMLLDLSSPLLDAVNFKALNVDVDCGGDDFEKLFHWRQISSSTSSSITSGINAYGEAVTDTPMTINKEPLDPEKATFRYTCGYGEGDAKERCSNPGWEDINCDMGSCPEKGMLCFVVECVKPKDYHIQTGTMAEVWVKSEPKPQVVRKPEKMTSASKMEVDSSTEADATTDIIAADTSERVQACGSDYYDAAANCGSPCQQHSDCSGGEFCWHVECGAKPPVTTTTTTPYSGPMVNKYQCGFDRTEAMTCQEECDVIGWKCGGDKDCYLVPCPA